MVTLEDKYALLSGRAYMSGVQALVRLPLLQRERDRAAGLDTAGFISGYRGSPLGNYDDELRKAARHLSAHDIHFVPGLNEDIAATSLWGTQQAALLPEARVEGVFGIWYGKGPGVDRSADVLKHANAAGTSAKGGVLAVMGDDHGCQSSTLPHQSDQIMAAAMIPVLNPANVQEHLDFGLLGIALSRYSGCWVGLKATTEVVESSAVVDMATDRVSIRTPVDHELPGDGLGIRWPDTPLDMERRLHGPKMEAVLAFARANRIDRAVWQAVKPRLCIVSTGKAYADVRQALDDLGIDERRAGELGLSLFKVGMVWPLEPAGVLAALAGHGEVLVIEEKRSFIEEQLAGLLVNRPEHVRLTGKRDEDGRAQLPSAGELDPAIIARVITERLVRCGADIAGIPALTHGPAPGTAAGKLQRTPFFCSGCPHNTSTRVPDGSRAMAGIGCHGMAYSDPTRQTSFITQMGGEGASWIGQAPFIREKHVFQNLGDGTYFHSGLLAIRAAGAAGVNITYKILFNDAVAMTGGQPHDGSLTVQLITRQVAAEGARRIVVVTDEPEKYDGVRDLAPGTTVRHRDDLDAVQRELREVPGLTVLVYDQTCAAEKRRRRKRGTFPDPQKRLFINSQVCEGCGDCSAKSNCISVKPLETELGRKRMIDQSDCNKDFSCINGFCPSFVTIYGGKPRKASRTGIAADVLADVPMPVVPALDQTCNILITGIGGTGVVTVGALLGMAAHIEGKGATVLDFTGLAQKNGGVASHVRLARDQSVLSAVRIGEGATDLLLGCDLVVAAADANLGHLDPSRSYGVVNDRVTPPSAFVRNGMLDISAAVDRKALRSRLAAGSEFIDATGLATALMGDSIASNLFLLGFAWQKGRVPLAMASIEQAIRLNGVAVDGNLLAFAWGRRAAHDMAAVEQAAGSRPARIEPFDLDRFVERRVADLVGYQDRAYSERYLSLVNSARAAETQASGGPGTLTEAVARNYFKLLAYKDEYEVARLFTDGRFAAEIAAAFEGDYTLEFNLAPPLFARRDKITGELKKRPFGPWMMPAFRVLAKLKGLRGTWLDPFGRLPDRRMERSLIKRYERELSGLIGNLTAASLPGAAEQARWPEQVRGFGHVKDRSIAALEVAAPDVAPKPVAVPERAVA